MMMTSVLSAGERQASERLPSLRAADKSGSDNGTGKVVIVRKGLKFNFAVHTTCTICSTHCTQPHQGAVMIHHCAGLFAGKATKKKAVSNTASVLVSMDEYYYYSHSPTVLFTVRSVLRR